MGGVFFTNSVTMEHVKHREWGASNLDLTVDLLQFGQFSMSISAASKRRERVIPIRSGEVGHA